jgi:hypothetical protein
MNVLIIRIILFVLLLKSLSLAYAILRSVFPDILLYPSTLFKFYTVQRNAVSMVTLLMVYMRQDFSQHVGNSSNR